MGFGGFGLVWVVVVGFSTFNDVFVGDLFFDFKDLLEDLVL
jgi:hypothetical protein